MTIFYFSKVSAFDIDEASFIAVRGMWRIAAFDAGHWCGKPVCRGFVRDGPFAQVDVDCFRVYARVCCHGREPIFHMIYTLFNL